LIKINDVLGLPVIYDNGEKSPGFLKDIIFNTYEKQVKAFIAERTGIMKDETIFELEDICDIGEGTVIIKKPTKASPWFKDKENRKYSDIDKKKEEIRVYTKVGEDLGTVKDIYFNLKTGYIEAFELSHGLVQDIIDGRKMIPLIGKYEFGKDNILVGKDAVQEMTNSGRGLKKKLFEK